MGRIRNAGGKTTKNIGGNYYIYAKGDIVFNSAKQVTENAKEGIIYGKAEPHPERENKENKQTGGINTRFYDVQGL